MAHFAKVEAGVVTNVIVAEQDFIDSGAVGEPSSWVQTSYNNNIRKRFAGIGYLYMPHIDAFVPPKPFDSWVLNEETAEWEAPTPRPKDDKYYSWDEETLAWKLVDNPVPLSAPSIFLPPQNT